MTAPFYIGVDPGVSGGWAMLDSQGGVVAWMKMADTPEGIAGQPGELILPLPPASRVRALVEKIHAFPAMGKAAAFTFGGSYWSIRTALTASSVPFDEVQPKLWQKIIGISYPPKLAARDKKNITKARAQQLFPRTPVTHAIADALLLAEVARRIDHAPEGWLTSIQSRRR